MTLEQKLKGIVKKINARKFKVEANVDDVSHYVDACINIQNWKINVTVDSNIEESLHTRFRKSDSRQESARRFVVCRIFSRVRS